MVTAVIVALWVVVMAVIWWWWAAASDQAAGVCTEVDPYSAEVAAFRAELHDWDRGGRA